MDKMIVHYYLHNTDIEDNINMYNHGFSQNYVVDDYNYPTYYRPPDTASIINQNQQLYTLTLISKQLQLVVYEDGSSRHPLPGEFLRVRQKMYYDGKNRIVVSDCAEKNYIYGRNKNPLPLEIAFALAKTGMKAKLIISPNLVPEILQGIENNRQNNLIYEMEIMGISFFPSSLVNLLDVLYIEILNLSIEGDKAFEEHNLQKALINYQNAIQRVYSNIFQCTLSDYRKQLQGKLSCKKEKNDEYNDINFFHNRKQVHEVKKKLTPLQIQKCNCQLQKIKMIEDLCQKISVKGIELAYLAKQYFKAIKWARIFLKNPQHEGNLRVMMVRANCYIQLQEPLEAIEQFKLIKLIYPLLPEIDQKLQNLKSSLQPQQSKNSRLQIGQKHLLKKAIAQNMDYLKVPQQQSQSTKKIKALHKELDNKPQKSKHKKKKKQHVQVSDPLMKHFYSDYWKPDHRQRRN